MTVYIGQPAFKKMGGRIGYSIVNALMFLIICFSGSASLIASICCVQAFEPIVAFVGLVIASESFTAANPRHYVAVLFGFIPTIAEFAFQTVGNNVAASYAAAFNLANDTVISFRNSTQDCNGNSRFIYVGDGVCEARLTGSQDIHSFGYSSVNGVAYSGLVSLGSGGVLVSLLLTAILILSIDRRFLVGAAWCMASSGLSLFGVIHSERVDVKLPKDSLAWRFAAGYGMVSLFLFGLWVAQRWGFVRQPIPDDKDLLAWIGTKSFNRQIVITETRDDIDSPSPALVAESESERVGVFKKRHSADSIHRRLLGTSSPRFTYDSVGVS